MKKSNPPISITLPREDWKKIKEILGGRDVVWIETPQGKVPVDSFLEQALRSDTAKRAWSTRKRNST
jgi:hypothetical protein